MIRVAECEDITQLEQLYRESFYQELPELIKQLPERVLVVEERHEILAAAYIAAGYDHLWAAYLVFRQIAAAKNLIEHLIRLGKEKDIKNLYVLCHRKFVYLRLYLATHNFVPKGIRAHMNQISHKFEPSSALLQASSQLHLA